MAEKDWILFAVGVSGTAVLLDYGGPPANEHADCCAVSLEMESCTDKEIMDSIEFSDCTFPEKAGLYRWEGTFTWFESKDWETGIVDDWHLIANSGILTPIATTNR